ncbi:MAG: prepilin-type N-terminal cleavage/methylation domain-containing protein [Dehalococcoidales bacterium]|jgi:prepilin-type N-terminal cleavage/methylation domain-containing protein
MNRQSGMTLVELIVAIAITGVIVAFLGTAIYQIITVSEYGNGRLTALHEVQNAAYWLNTDGQGARNATGGSQLVLTLSDNTTVTYALSGTDLRRSAGGLPLTVARNITSASFSVSGRMITINLTSAPVSRDNVSQNGTYMVYLRPQGGS